MVHWRTIQVIMVLAAKLKLYSVQCNITAAFVHGQVPEDEETYVHQPRGLYQKGNNHVLKLKRTLYGLKQAPQYFFKYFTERLIRQGLTPSEFDPCLFFGSYNLCGGHSDLLKERRQN
jgi:hypothetical protein